MLLPLPPARRLGLTLTAWTALTILTLPGPAPATGRARTQGPAREASAPEDALPPASGATLEPVRLEGRVRWAGSTPLRLKSFTNDVDVAACGRRVRSAAVQAGRRGVLRHVLVEVLDPDGSILPAGRLEPPDVPIELSLDSCSLEPHVLVIPPGSRVEIANPDGILHELIAPALRNEPVAARLPRFRRRLALPEEQFRRPERIRVSCSRHTWAGGWWVVTSNAHHALTGADGRFTLPGVPPGTWLVRAWHGEFGTLEQEVVLAPGERRELDFDYR